MKTYVLYHANCWDGFCAAWIARGVLKGDVEFIPVQYGHEPPKIEPMSRLYILDFSYPKEHLFKWWIPGPESVDHLIILDHHKTAQENLGTFCSVCESTDLDIPKIVFDMNKSGARLTWEHFHKTKKSPGIVDYTEDRDLWRWSLPDSREVNSAIRSFPMDFEWVDKIGKSSAESLRMMFAESGAAILRREQQIVDEHVRHAREIDMDGHKILCVNATVLISEIAGELASGRPFGACYFYQEDGKKQWSLRSRDGGIDVSVIAKARGGGGHRNAAGFQEG
jgi:uncharacterized protein